MGRWVGGCDWYAVCNESETYTEEGVMQIEERKCRKALVHVVQYQPHFISLPSTTYPKA